MVESGANDPRCQIMIVMGKTSPDHPERHRQQSMILVLMRTPGVTVLRHLPVFGYDDAPHGHGEILFEDVRVPLDHILLGEGRGFEIAQDARSRPHPPLHASIGLAERPRTAVQTRMQRRAFGRLLLSNR